MTPDKKWIVVINDDGKVFFIKNRTFKIYPNKYIENTIFDNNNSIIITPDSKWKVDSYYSEYWINPA